MIRLLLKSLLWPRKEQVQSVSHLYAAVALTFLGRILESHVRRREHPNQNGQGEVKDSMGNGEAKELTWVTHGQELRAGRGGMLVGGVV